MTTRRTAASLLGVAALLIGGTSTALAAKPEVHQVTICHATSSESNPYTQATVDVASTGLLLGGHNGHTGDGVWYPGAKSDGFNWGDIIPPYEYAPASYAFAGLNWTEDGQALYANDCLAAVQGDDSEAALPELATVVHLGATDDGEPAVVDNANPADAGATVHDSALLSWSGDAAAPDGSTVSFSFFANGTCAGEPTDASAPFDVSGDSSGAVVDPGLVETSLEPGSYSFQAAFASGDETVLLSTDGACEPFVVLADTGAPETAPTPLPSEPNTATIGGLGTSGPSNGSWLLIAMIGALLGSIIVMAPTRGASRR
jgi:hypothetical protein